MGRKSPGQHKVTAHTRKRGTIQVHSYTRGKGSTKSKGRTTRRRSIKAMEVQRLERIKIGRPSKPKKRGDPISYKLPTGRTARGTVIKEFKGYYLVEQDKTKAIHRVNKGSIFYKIGGALGKIVGTVRGTVRAMEGAYETEKQAVEEFIKARRRRRLAQVRQI